MQGVPLQGKGRPGTGSGLERKQIPCILRGPFSEFLKGHAPQFSNLFRDVAHVPRFIAPSADRFRCHVGAVSLNQKALKGHIAGRFLQFRRFLKGHRARKGDIKAQFQVFPGNFPAA